MTDDAIRYLPYWCYRDWWQYIFYPIRWQQKICDPWWWIRIPLCRWRGHPAGVQFFNPGAQEPDMTCRECGDDLG